MDHPASAAPAAAPLYTGAGPPGLRDGFGHLSAPVAGLGTSERAEAELVSRRLAAELRGVIELLPEAERGASAMSRKLGLDRVTCQRIVGAVGRIEGGVETLVRLPGVQGLRQFIEAMTARGVRDAAAGAEQLEAAAAAVERFEGLITELAGSQRKLRARLAAERAGEGGTGAASDDPATRQALFRAGAAVTGRWSDTSISLVLIRPTPGDPLLTESIRVRGLIGHKARADAVPLEIGQTAPQRPAEGAAFETLDAPPRPASGQSPRSLLSAFCSSPPARVISRSAGPGGGSGGGGGARVVHVIDFPEGAPSGEAGADAVIADRGTRPDRHPATQRPPVGEVWALINFPSRRLLFDVYLHRDIARRCLPTLELHLWTPDVGGHGSSRWSTRFPGGPRLELLGGGLRGARSASYARHEELTGHVFEQSGWDADEFVGYRCEVTCPVWRAGYCMVFDFTGNELAG